MPFRDPVGAMTRPEALDYTLVILGSTDEVPPGYLLGASRLSLGAGEADDVYLAGVGVAPGAAAAGVEQKGEVTGGKGERGPNCGGW